MLADYTQQLQQIDRERKEIGDNAEVYTRAQRERLEVSPPGGGPRHARDDGARPVTERDLAITYQRIALSQLDSSDEDSRAIIGVLTRVLEYLLNSTGISSETMGIAGSGACTSRRRNAVLVLSRARARLLILPGSSVKSLQIF